MFSVSWEAILLCGIVWRHQWGESVYVYSMYVCIRRGVFMCAYCTGNLEFVWSIPVCKNSWLWAFEFVKIMCFIVTHMHTHTFISMCVKKAFEWNVITVKADRKEVFSVLSTCCFSCHENNVRCPQCVSPCSFTQRALIKRQWGRRPCFQLIQPGLCSKPHSIKAVMLL